MTSVTADMVRDLYVAILGREPENPQVVEGHVASGLPLSELIGHFLASAEYRGRLGPPPGRSDFDLLFDGITRQDEDLMRRHLAPAHADPEFLTTFVGTRQRAEFNTDTYGRGGFSYNDIPTHVGDICAEAIEYVGVIKAIEAGSGPFVAVELGAGIGTWSVISGHLARRNGRSPIRLYPVEASQGKVANMRDHFRDNGFDPDEHRITQAIIGPIDGTAYFPNVDVTGDWGGEAVFSSSDEEREGYSREKCITMATLLKDEKLVDLLHCDIQGAEAQVIPNALETMNAKVRYAVIATHSRDIDIQLIGLMTAAGWTLVNEQLTRVIRQEDSVYTRIDGTLVWRNNALC
jgi:FkbM family methyltransferase